MASNFAIRQAAHQVRNGGVIVYPTETVYGLGCDPMNADAVNTLCRLKNRDLSKGLILLGNSIKLFRDLISPLNADEIRLISDTEQPTSWIVSARTSTPDWLTGNRDTLVIRITEHPVVNKLCNRLGFPLVSSSANPGGHKPAINAFQAHRYFHHRVNVILASAASGSGRPSVIRRLGTNELLRS